MLKLATILDNPGAPQARTMYRDPAVLAELGYNGVVLYDTTSLSGVHRPEDVVGDELRRWVDKQFDQVRQSVEAVRAAGLAVYLSYDALSLVRQVVESRRDALCCKNDPTMLCPASEPAVTESVAALAGLIERFAPVTGVVLRFGDNDALRTPYLIGNDLYMPHCARCSHLGRADRIITVLKPFHEQVVERMNLRLILRAWNVRPRGMHDSEELARRVAQRLPGDPTDDRLILSFKFTQTDFWRYQPWNASSLVCGQRPVIYELECQREFEGKGAIPNWQPPLWRDGDQDDSGLARVADKVNLAGLWAWVRGGGWGGPFVSNETWIDSNVFAVPRLADNPQLDTRELARQWINQRLDLHDDRVTDVIQNVLEHSPTIIRDAFYIGPFAQLKQDPWHPGAGWIQDDLLDAQAALRMVDRLPDRVLDQVVREKQQAVDLLTVDRAALQQVLASDNRRTLEPLIHTMEYAESLFKSLRDLLAGLVAYRRFKLKADDQLKQQCQHRLLAAQEHWNHHTQRTATLSGAATAFRESQFWDLTQRILAELS